MTFRGTSSRNRGKVNEPGTGGKKLSKSDDSEKRAQENRLLEKYLDAQIAWIREGTEESLLAYRKVSDEYKRQYDHH